MTITANIEIPEDALLDVFITHEAIWDYDFSYDRPKKCMGCEWTAVVDEDDNEVQFEQHLVQAVKDQATASENERLERPFRDSRW